MQEVEDNVGADVPFMKMTGNLPVCPRLDLRRRGTKVEPFDVDSRNRVARWVGLFFGSNLTADSGVYIGMHIKGPRSLAYGELHAMQEGMRPLLEPWVFT